MVFTFTFYFFKAYYFHSLSIQVYKWATVLVVICPKCLAETEREKWIPTKLYSLARKVLVENIHNMSGFAELIKYVCLSILSMYLFFGISLIL